MDEKELKELADKIDGKIQKMAEEGKSMTAEAKKELKDELKQLTDQYTAAATKLEADMKSLQESVDSLKAENKRAGLKTGNPVVDAFKGVFESEQFKSYVADRKKGSKKEFNSSLGEIELKTLDVATATATVTAPEQPTTIIYEPDRKRHIRDFIPSIPTNSNRVIVPVESAITDGSATVGIGGSKLNSEFDLTITTFPVQKIAVGLQISEEMLDDVPGLVAYITTRFGNKLRNREDAELLYNTASSTEFGGITTVAQAYVDTLGDSAVTEWDVLRAAITQGTVDEYTPTHIFLNPADVMKLRNRKDSTGQFLGGAAPWNPAGLMVDGVQIISTTAITAGDFLVGDMNQGALIYDRRSPSIRFYDQDGTNAQTGLITVIIDERLTLAVVRPNAFIFGTFAEALAKGSA